MTRAQTVSLVTWLGPVVLAFVLVAMVRPARRLMAGVGLALAWNLWSVLAVNVVALRLGWWSFDPALPSFMGIPFEVWLGWVVLWGVVAPLAGSNRPLLVVVIALLWLDLILMPLLQPVVTLHRQWIAGEAVALGVALVPGLLLARWTASDTKLYQRVALQVACVGPLVLWLVPSIAMKGSWGGALHADAWQWSVASQLLVVPISLGVRAAIEFARIGRGTPIPYDPPRRLVRTGPYAYVRNPMQLAMVLVFAMSSVPLRNLWMLAAAAIAFAYSAGLAEWHENIELSARYGAEWQRYRRLVRAWLPRWRPAIADEATLYVAFSCGVCSSVGRWFLRRSPRGLILAPAEAVSGSGLRRITYAPAVGPTSQGVAAIARALEHIHLGWALVGWILSLPGVVHLAEVISDVCAPGPQRVQGRDYDALACAVDRVPGS